ncbi:hypothetical protein [Cupriavidus neocaledonicus]|uniref:Uncharacterized protein n=1 Tax=Cupriavidus neocaledonicus TaxID=1040979 RepID=A0A375HRN1_9BURK|nr:hypothetical protein [Cupriavidus neocaledonicus]SOZ39837.1 hypothetical protein CBM2605_B50009 [Cupriavidus neocaledonicus]SPD60829.1 protein of unknown function [Cupriavidus neocaledonicus]
MNTAYGNAERPDSGREIRADAFSLVLLATALPAALPMLTLAFSHLPLKSTLAKLLMTLL